MKHNSNSFPFTISSDIDFSQQNSFNNSKQTVFLNYYTVVAQIS